MYRKFYLVPGQQAPLGSTGTTTSDGGIIWIGELWLNEEINSVLMTSEETKEFIQNRLETALDRHINEVAQSRNYDDRISCTLRAAYINPWQAEGVAFGTWMDYCYVAAFKVMADVDAGTRPIPTSTELISEMPIMVWPEI